MGEHHHQEDRLPEAIAALARELHALAQHTQNQSILHRLDQLEKNIMSKVSDFLIQQTKFNDELEIKVDAANASQVALASSLQGVAGDVSELNRLITQIQNSAGEFTPADQVTADAIQARGAAISAKFKAAADALAASATALAALDSLTPPAVPPTA